MTPDLPQTEAQHSAHNKAPVNAARVRLSWIIVLCVFLLLGITAVMIMAR